MGTPAEGGLAVLSLAAFVGMLLDLWSNIPTDPVTSPQMLPGTTQLAHLQLEEHPHRSSNIPTNAARDNTASPPSAGVTSPHTHTHTHPNARLYNFQPVHYGPPDQRTN